jgi:peptidoglycan/xylan/chitin deacetylase (PgdA/CDA1 family)
MAGVGRDRRQARRRAVAGWTVAAAAFAVLVVTAACEGQPWLLIGALAAAALFALLADRIMRRAGAVPIIVYHSVSPAADWLPWADNISVRPETFRLHMEILREDGWTVLATRELVAARRAGRGLPERSVVIHFDDGYLDNFQIAAPILRAAGFPATFFVSADFIEPGAAVRACPSEGGLPGPGYMTAAEMRLLDADPLFEIAAHGLDHARIPVSPRVVARLEPLGWRRHVASVWALQPGSKARWFEAETPAPLAFGDPVRESDSALCGRWWREDGIESEAERDARVNASLLAARARFEDVLGRPVDLLCWPFDRWTEAARASARAAGFLTVTGGRGENLPGDDPDLLSRVHVHDRAFGGGGLWPEAIAFRARLALLSGNLYATYPVALASLLRRRRFRRPGVHA